jgi:uncharacterized protein (TIGR01589 family)
MCCISEARLVKQPAIWGPQLASSKPVGVADVSRVHHAIERCLTNYLTLEETAAVLQSLGVVSAFTQLVWRQLEAQNPSFFQTYYAAVSSRRRPKPLVESAARAA